MPYGRRGAEFVVSKQNLEEQTAPSVAGFAGGGFIMVWTTSHTLQDGSGRAIKAQRYDSAGNAVGSEVLINSSAAGDQRAPSVTTLVNGGFVVTWETTDAGQDGSGVAIKGQLFDSGGAKVGVEFLVNSQSASDQTVSSVTGLEGGGFVVTWATADSTQDGFGSAIKGQIYSSAGVAVGGEFLVNSGAVGHESAPSVTSLSGGGFVATWTRGSGTSADIYAQVFDSNGAKTGSQFLVSTTSINNQDLASVSEISGGRFVVTWQHDVSINTIEMQVRARIFSADGTPIGDDFLVNTPFNDPVGNTPAAQPSRPSVDNLPDGGFVITWTNEGGNYDRTSVRGQFFDSSGNRVGSEVMFSTATDRFEDDGDVAVDGNGMVFAVWQSANQSAFNFDIRGQIYIRHNAPEIVSNGGGSTASVTVGENQNAAATILALDSDGPGALVYSIVGGADAARFAINASTGALTFISAPNFESPQDAGANNVYDVVVSVTDNSLTDTQALAVTVANVNEGVTIAPGETAYFSAENWAGVVASFSASDVDGDPVTWSIAGGADGALFMIDAVTGALRFITARDFEIPADVGGDNVYNVTIAASDGSLTDTRALTVQISNRNDGPVIISGGGGASASYSVAENSNLVTTIVADDPDATNRAFSFSIAGGADAALFNISAQTGQLTFKSGVGANFEAPADAGGDNVYNVIVAVSDGLEPADTQALSITVTDANDAPVITSPAFVSAPENQLAVTTVTATDLENAAITYAIVGGVDSVRFTINAQTGVLRFASAPNREAPGDSGANNVYNVTVSASDGQKSTTQALSVTVSDVDEAPVIKSNGGGSAAAISVAENGLAVTSVAATDPEGRALAYSISGGADASRFAIDSATGALSFLTAPDHEQPTDLNGDNVYQVVVSASDGVFSDSQALTVTVGDVNEGVTITSGSAKSVAENSSAVMTVTAQDLDGDAVSYSISGGADSALFAVNSQSGALSFLAAPNFEAPADSDRDNVYEVEVSASDGILTGSKPISVTVTNQNEAIAFTSGGGGDQAAVTVDENSGNVLALLAFDPDGSPPHYGIAGGADGALFELDPVTKALRFKSLPDFEAPGDSDGDNLYEVVVGVTDGQSFDYQTVTVTVGNVDEGVAVTSGGGADSFAVTVAENDTVVTSLAAADGDGDPVVYSITGGADALRFAVDSQTGALSFVQAANFEAPADSDGDNVYDVVVSATDGTFTDSQSIAVTVGDFDEPVELVSYGGAAVVAVTSPENSFATGIVVEARDEEDPAVTYAITGGADAGFFRIDPATGALSFAGANAPDFEDPSDFDGDNIHEVAVTASSSTSSATQAFMISVTNRNEAPGLYNPALSVDEGEREVATVVARDKDGDVPTYAIAGGPDAALFEIDPATGLLSFIEARDYETPLSAAGTNVYTLEIEASDGRLTTRETFQVTVGNVNEGVTIISGGGGEAAAFTVDENGVAVTTVTAGDRDGDAVTYSIAGGADSSRFAIDARTGALSFVEAPNFEAPGDAGGNNVYDVVVSATDGAFTDSQSVTVTVGNVDEPVELVSYGGAAAVALNLIEDRLAVGVVEARDQDSAVTYSIAGGADAGSFRIDPVTGALSFEHDAPDFEDPTDSDGDNVHEVVVAASSSTSSVTQAFAISITNRNEAPELYPDPSLSVDEGRNEVGAVHAFDPDGDALAYRIVGGPDAASFTLDPGTGVLKFVGAPDYEAPLSAAGTNVYTLEIEAGDGEYVSRQTFQVAVRNVNEGLSITSGGGAAAFAVTASENFTAVTGIAASDSDGDSITYSIAGGADSSRFEIDARTGALRFVQAPNFEAPSDSGGDNVYDVVVSATDGTFTDTQALAVTVANLNEALVITSNGGGAGASVAVPEKGTAVTTVAARDPDGGTVTYAIAGGSDSARFTIDSATGVLAFVSAPDFEAPGDSGGDNVYDVLVSASDGSFTDTQAIAVMVGNVNEAPVITSNGGGAAGAVSVAENSAAIVAVAATDPDGTKPSYSIVGGADSARFTINAQTGALQFVVAPDWELPGDFDRDNVYSVIVRSSDGQLVDDQALNVTVTNVRDGNNVTGTSGVDSIFSGSAVIAMRTSNEEDTVFGRDGNDTIQGMAGDDDLYGEGGNDVLIGGTGADRLTGGLGKDQFTYNSVSESTGALRDLIMDFSRSQGDKISLSGIDANSLVSTNQAFTFIGTSAFSNVAGQLRYETSAGATTIFGDVNGDGIADLQIQLSGSIPLIASDFVL
jgi:hypothetical protein